MSTLKRQDMIRIQYHIHYLIIISFSGMRWQQRTARWKSCARKSENCNRSSSLLLWLSLIFNYADACADIQSCWYRLWCWGWFSTMLILVLMLIDPTMTDVNAWHCGSCWFLQIFIQEMRKSLIWKIETFLICWVMIAAYLIFNKRFRFQDANLGDSYCWKIF